MNETITTTQTIPVRIHTVKLIGVLASAAGRRELHISMPLNSTVSQVITKILQEVGNMQFKDFLVDSATQDPRPNVIILLDEQDCNIFNGLKTRLEMDTKITIIPVAHGG